MFSVSILLFTFFTFFTRYFPLCTNGTFLRNLFRYMFSISIASLLVLYFTHFHLLIFHHTLIHKLTIFVPFPLERFLAVGLGLRNVLLGIGSAALSQEVFTVKSQGIEKLVEQKGALSGRGKFPLYIFSLHCINILSGRTEKDK